jgi:hypothetical protein
LREDAVKILSLVVGADHQTCQRPRGHGARALNQCGTGVNDGHQKKKAES